MLDPVAYIYIVFIYPVSSFQIPAKLYRHMCVSIKQMNNDDDNGGDGWNVFNLEHEIQCLVHVEDYVHYNQPNEWCCYY